MAHHDPQKPLEPLASVLDDIVAETIREDLARKRGDRDARRLALENVSEVLKVGVAAADDGVAQAEGGDVGARVDLVRGVHCARGGAVSLWVLDLERRRGW